MHLLIGLLLFLPFSEAQKGSHLEKSTCPLIQDKEQIKKLALELIQRDLNGYRISICKGKKERYTYLDSEESKFGDEERQVPSKKIIFIKESSSKIILDKISISDLGEISVSYEIATLKEEKTVRISDNIRFILSPVKSMENKNCADVVSFPKNVILYDTCK
ncbi:MAG: hypothetical protein KDD34_00500 [Bdellovibrionales bacterium]|nr:hypothetical protein [Bdellovibrionales bacterium]